MKNEELRMKNRINRRTGLRRFRNRLFVSFRQIFDLPDALSEFVRSGDEGQLEAAFFGELQLGADLFGFRIDEALQRRRREGTRPFFDSRPGARR